MREARLAAGLTQQELADAAGISQQNSISLWETGRRDIPRAPTVWSLANVLGVDPGYLLATGTSQSQSTEYQRGYDAGYRDALGAMSANISALRKVLRAPKE